MGERRGGGQGECIGNIHCQSRVLSPKFEAHVVAQICEPSLNSLRMRGAVLVLGLQLQSFHWLYGSRVLYARGQRARERREWEAEI